MKRSITAVAALAAVLLMIFGCDFLVGPDEPAGGGNLVIGFGDGRAAAPTAAAQAALRYELVLTGPGGQVKTVSLSPGQIFNEQAALGEWHISAEAYDSGNTLIGKGSTTVTVKAGVNQARIPMVASSFYFISLSETGTYTFTAVNDYDAGTPPSSLRVTVENTGNEETGDLTAALSGANPGSFTLNPPLINSIPVGGTDILTVAPNPMLAAGTYTAAVTVSGGGGISEGFTVSFTVNDTTPPFDVTGLAGTPGSGGVAFTWADPADADLDHIEITFTPLAGGIEQPILVAKGAEAATITGLTNGNAYTFTVKAVDTAGNESTGEDTTLTPLAPTGTITVVFDGLPADETITLGSLSSPSWAANTGLNVSVGETFEEYRWHLDGVAVTGATSSSIMLIAGNLEIKQHTLTVFVTKNGIEYAKAVTFTVIL